MPDEKNVYRTDYKNPNSTSTIHGYYVRGTINGHRVNKYFGDATYGGREESFRAAVDYRDRLLSGEVVPKGSTSKKRGPGRPKKSGIRVHPIGHPHLRVWCTSTGGKSYPSVHVGIRPDRCPKGPLDCVATMDFEDLVTDEEIDRKARETVRLLVGFEDSLRQRGRSSEPVTDPDTLTDSVSRAVSLMWEKIRLGDFGKKDAASVPERPNL